MARRRIRRQPPATVQPNLIFRRPRHRIPRHSEPRHRRRPRHTNRHRRVGQRVTRLLPARAPQPAVLRLHIHRELPARGQIGERITRPRFRLPTFIVIANAHLIPISTFHRHPARGEPRHRCRTLNTRHNRRNGQRVTRLLPARAPQPAILRLNIHRELPARRQLRERMARPQHRHPILIVITNANLIPISPINRGPTSNEPRHRRRRTRHHRLVGQRVARLLPSRTPQPAVLRLHIHRELPASGKLRERITRPRLRLPVIVVVADAHLIPISTFHRHPARGEPRRRRRTLNTRHHRRNGQRVTRRRTGGTPAPAVACPHFHRELAASGKLRERMARRRISSPPAARADAHLIRRRPRRHRPRHPKPRRSLRIVHTTKVRRRRRPHDGRRRRGRIDSGRRNNRRSDADHADSQPILALRVD